MLQHTSDRWLFFTVLCLMLFGLLMVYSSSGMLAEQNHSSHAYFALRQGIWFILGVLVIFSASFVPYGIFQNKYISYGLLILSLALIAATFFYPPINNAHRWIKIGGLSFQPSEFAKWVLIVFTASSIVRNHNVVEGLKAYREIIAAVGIIFAMLLFQPDYGMAVLMLLVAGTIVFASGMRWRYVMGAAVTASAAMAIALALMPSRLERIKTFLHSSPDLAKEGFQAHQSVLAIGSGGLWGKGLGESNQKMFFLPEPHTDFIYSIICEELGYIAGVAVLAAFLVILWRGLRIAHKIEEPFGALLATGITISLAAQALINMGVALAILPTKGTTLPFLSYGGSSLIVSCIGIGMLLNISSHIERDEYGG